MASEGLYPGLACIRGGGALRYTVFSTPGSMRLLASSQQALKAYIEARRPIALEFLRAQFGLSRSELDALIARYDSSLSQG